MGLLNRRKRPAGPVELVGEVEIARPAAQVYALIDWADPRNARRTSGNEVRPVPGKPERFDLVMSEMPDLTFELLVTCAQPHACYAFGCMIQPALGTMEHCHETYRFEDLGEDRCRVTLTTQTSFIAGLSRREYSAEVVSMAGSLENALQKLKLTAEHGAENARSTDGKSEV